MVKELTITRIEKNDDKELYELLAFIALATNDGEPRKFMRYINVDDDRIAAADGHRVHYSEKTFDIENGFYKPEISPDHINLVPEKEMSGWPKNISEVINDGYGEFATLRCQSSISYMFYPVFRAGAVIDVKYLQPLSDYSSGWKFAVHEEKPEINAVKFVRHESFTGAIIMPIAV